VIANVSSSYLEATLDQADEAVQVVDYHTYANDPGSTVIQAQQTISDHNFDGDYEPIWVSEWGALWSSYDSQQRAMVTAHQLVTFSQEGVDGATIFNLTDWSTTAGQDYGLIDLRDDGFGGANRVRTETYYAYRLLLRGLIGGKERLAHTTNGLAAGTRTMLTRDPEAVYLIALRDSVGATATLEVDLSAIGSGSGQLAVWEYSASNKDELVAMPMMTDALFSVNLPADGLTLVRIGRPPLAVTIHQATVSRLPRTFSLILGFLGAILVSISLARRGRRKRVHN